MVGPLVVRLSPWQSFLNQLSSCVRQGRWQWRDRVGNKDGGFGVIISIRGEGVFTLAQQVSLRVVVEQTHDKEQISQLVYEGRDLGEPVPAVWIEVAYVWKERYLLVFATGDCPFEETLYIYMFDLQKDTLVDRASIFMGSGVFQEHQIKDFSAVCFMVSDIGPFKVEVFDTPKFVFRTVLSKYFWTINRPFAQKRYFGVALDNKPT